MDTSPRTSQANAGDGVFKDSFESAAPTNPEPALPPFAIRVFNKCAYGPRPGDVAAFNALGSSDDARLSAWIAQQLDPDTVSDNDCTQRIAAGNYSTRTMTLPQMWATHVRGSAADGGPAAWPRRYYPCDEAACMKLVRALYSKRQLFEVMVDFWHSHFNVQGWEFSIAPVFMHYDRDVMRGKNDSNRYHALGNFRTLLEQVAKAPAMLFYLNNKSSRAAGFNENFARELCELHTLGAAHYYPGNDPYGVPVDAQGNPLGYCDNDVYEAARALTGWTVNDNQTTGDTGEFVYRADWHDVAGKFFLRRYIMANRPAEEDGKTVFDLLCRHRGTAITLSRKLCQRFISDTPPQALVESAADIWQAQWQSDTQIAQVLQHILTSDAFKSAWGEKTKRPWEALMHALRATATELTPQPRPVSGWDSYTELNDRLQQTGHGPFRWPTPDGYPDTRRKWQAVSPLAQTWRLIARLPEMRVPGTGNTAFFQRIVDTTRSGIPSAQRNTARIVDFWIERIYGYSINTARRQQMIDFMRQNATAAAVLNLDEDTIPASGEQMGIPQNTGIWKGDDLSRHYTLVRLRAMVSLLMMCPEFHHR